MNSTHIGQHCMGIYQLAGARSTEMDDLPRSQAQIAGMSDRRERPSPETYRADPRDGFPFRALPISCFRGRNFLVTFKSWGKG